MDAMKETLFIVVPCYNEQEVLPETSKRLKSKMQSLIDSGKISEKSRICFVNDGSKDQTWQLIESYHKSSSLFCGINLSSNRGHQNALLAGLMTVRSSADMVISMDADLQDDIDVIDQMVDKYLDGCDIVYGIRGERETDRFLKRFTAEAFYRFMNALGANTIFNHADFRLMSKRALDALSEFKEVNLFLRGIIPMIGFKSDYVVYKRSKRFAGKSKYSVGKMLALAFEGITSFSIKPIRIIALLGLISILIGISILIYTIVMLCLGNTVSGWASLMVSIWGIGGVILVSIEMIGEYIGKIYLETKSRPRYIVKQVLNDDNDQNND